MINGEIIYNDTFIERYKHAENISKLSKNFKTKPQYHFKNDVDKIDSLLKLEPQDGIIFTSNTKLKQTIVYKYKDQKHLTIEFTIYYIDKSTCHLLTPIKKNMLNYIKLDVADYNQQLPTFDNSTYFLVQFQPFIDKHAYIWKTIEDKKLLHMKIGEFKYDVNKQNWDLIKTRDDKSFGNDFVIANILFNQLFNPITIHFLKKPVLESYFQQAVDFQHREHTKFVSFVRHQLYKQLKKRNVKNILILCAGKGQEVFISQALNADNIVFIDNDFDALDTLITRIYELDNIKYYPEHTLPEKFSRNYVMIQNLKDDYKKIIENINKYTDITSFDAIIINLGLHYIIDSADNCNNFISLVNSLLNIDGIFLFTSYNGNILFDILKKNKEYKVAFNNDIIYHILPKFDIKKAQLDYSCQIDVLLPFTKVYYTENLLDIEKITDILITHKKYELRQYGPLTNYMDIYFKELLEHNLSYSALYYYVSVVKV